MMSEWKEYKVKDFAEVIGGGTPSTKNPLYFGGKIPWLTPRDMTNHKEKFIKNGDRNITEEGLKNSSAKIISKNSILLTSRAPIGYLAIAKNDVTTNQGFKSLVINPEVADYNFIYYLIKGNIEVIKQFGTGTTFAEISGTIVNNLKFKLPDLSTQTTIAEILSSLDDKIELNNNINKELEKLAQTLFKQWFIDFEFPDQNGEPYQSSGGEMVESELGMIPKEWAVVKLSELLTVKYGKDHKHLLDGDVPLYGSGGIMRFVEKPLYSKDSILIPRKGTLSNLFYLSEPFWSVDTMFYTEIHNASFGKYLFFVIKSLNLAAMDVGSAVPSMTTKVLNGIKVLKPVDFVMLQFDEIASSIFEKMNHNTKENQELSNLRDTLLPKLISGELNVKDL